MRKLFATVLPLVLLSILLAGCVVQSQPTSAGDNTVTMGPNNFLRTAITIKAGGKIIFSTDKATGTMHILVIGKQGAAEKEDGAPDFGSNGVTVNPGDSWTSPTWNKPGTYDVTCIVHPQMNLIVTVTA